LKEKTKKSKMPRHVSQLWQPYDTSEVPKTGGIYLIKRANGRIQYVGQSKNLHQRLNGHKYSRQQTISEYVKNEFANNNGKTLRIAWFPEKNHKDIEGRFLEALAKAIGYWPSKNKKRGNKCQLLRQA